MGEGCREGGWGEGRLLWREGGDERGRKDMMSLLFGGGPTWLRRVIERR